MNPFKDLRRKSTKIIELILKIIAEKNRKKWVKTIEIALLRRLGELYLPWAKAIYHTAVKCSHSWKLARVLTKKI